MNAVGGRHPRGARSKDGVDDDDAVDELMRGWTQHSIRKTKKVLYFVARDVVQILFDRLLSFDPHQFELN